MKYTEILDFWFQNSKKWFNWGGEFDTEITEKYLEIYNQAIEWELDEWIENPESCLALIIILDQFSRNMFRWDPRTFEYDFKALYIAKIALKKWYLEILPERHKSFILMPLMHSESLPDQDLCIKKFIEISEDGKWNTYAVKHRDIIAKFWRFPHRNKVLSRESTPEELEFLKIHTGF